MTERSALITYLRGEIVGPAIPLLPSAIVEIVDGKFNETAERTRGVLVWKHPDSDEPQEILYHDRETPHRKYGAGLLSPEQMGVVPAEESAAQATDTLGVEVTSEPESAAEGGDEDDVGADSEPSGGADNSAVDDYEVTSADIRHPSTMGISFCATLPDGAAVVFRMPRNRQFPWQATEDKPFQVNGRYEGLTRVTTIDGATREYPASRRSPAVGRDAQVEFSVGEVRRGTPARKQISTTLDSMVLSVEMYARKLKSGDDDWLLTLVLRNRSNAQQVVSALRAATLYQSYFEIQIQGGALRKYPESQRPFAQLDSEEQSMMLLYQESSTWAIGHGCAAAWDVEPGQEPTFLYADVMPAVELPSMTPDIEDDQGRKIRLGMRELSQLDDEKDGAGWSALGSLVDEYERWIDRKRAEIPSLPEHFRSVAGQHLVNCEECLTRIRRGVALLESDTAVRSAFRLANLAMLLQQIATKRIPKASMRWDPARKRAERVGRSESPWSIYSAGTEGDAIGHWRPFQAAFLLMQLEGVTSGTSSDRSLIDLIWFPTGGGKTEAYLGVMAFNMFHRRLVMKGDETPARDGTTVFMRYTLRMLTTQQFQRAASLICAMEYMRRHGISGEPSIVGRPFSLALWIGGEGSPNKIEEARQAVKRFKDGKEKGNPLVLTDCPWCRAAVGLVEVPRQGNVLLGVMEPDRTEGPRLLCPDANCEYGKADPRTWLPVEVIDERIYRMRPSLVIATADKFAILAYRPQARTLFGLEVTGRDVVRAFLPPSLIIQDELHLIAGPLGTMYALYEGVIERLCSSGDGDQLVRPKIIASTATIRGAADQTLALYARTDTNGGTAVRLFPAPGLRMGDSFFGVYAREKDGRLRRGRLYLGIHANEYGSVLTAQVRSFAAAICRAGQLQPERRDAWWTLLNFYNSLRELGGAKTLFDSDIRSRLKFLQNRENLPQAVRRRLQVTEELTSRLSQAEIVGMMDRLGVAYDASGNKALDACLASSIIEVGVDIDRLSLMGVVGQPKTTAQYIQVTGRVGRKWEERPGLILAVYNPGKSRDRSHYEQFHSYHRRLYERVEPTSATPFALSAIQRGLSGALIVYARALADAPVGDLHAYRKYLDAAFDLLADRCRMVQSGDDLRRSLNEMGRVRDTLVVKWGQNPQEFEDFPPSPEGEYLMLWPGQYATKLQQHRGVVVPSSMRQVDASGDLVITSAYAVNG